MRYDMLNRLMDTMSLQGEPIPGQSLIEIAGDRRVLIENHHGVKEYSRECVAVKVKFGQLTICGSCLELTCMNKEQMIISGRIDSVTLKRG